MTIQEKRNDYWQQLSESHVLIQHGAEMEDGSTRKSFTVQLLEEIEASEFIKLDLPAVIVGVIDGRIIIKEGANKVRYQNKLLFLTRFGVDSNTDPSLPASMEAATALTYEIMQDFLNKLQSDYEESVPCGDFAFIDESSYRWEFIEIMGSNMCGWALYFNDETNYHFTVDQNKWI